MFGFNLNVWHVFTKKIQKTTKLSVNSNSVSWTLKNEKFWWKFEVMFSAILNKCFDFFEFYIISEYLGTLETCYRENIFKLLITGYQDKSPLPSKGATTFPASCPTVIFNKTLLILLIPLHSNASNKKIKNSYTVHVYKIFPPYNENKKYAILCARKKKHTKIVWRCSEKTSLKRRREGLGLMSLKWVECRK